MRLFFVAPYNMKKKLLRTALSTMSLRITMLCATCAHNLTAPPNPAEPLMRTMRTTATTLNPVSYPYPTLNSTLQHDSVRL